MDFRVQRPSPTKLRDPEYPYDWGYRMFRKIWRSNETFDADEKQALAHATPGQRAIYAITLTDAEIQNGGFHQFFWNSTGALVDEAIAGTDLVQAMPYGSVLRAAASLFPESEVPEDRPAR